MTTRDLLRRTAIASVLLASVVVGCSRESDGDRTGRLEDTSLGEYLHGVAGAVEGEGDARLRLLDTPEVFSLALPDGSVAVSRGMLEVIAGEAEFACMYAHEVAHHRLGHVEAGSAFDPEGLEGAKGRERLSAHEKDVATEIAADRLAIDLCAAAGYDPIGLPDLLYRVGSYAGSESEDLGAGPAAAVGLPSRVLARIEAVLAHIETTGAVDGALGIARYSQALLAHRPAAAAAGPPPPDDRRAGLLPCGIAFSAHIPGVGYWEPGGDIGNEIECLRIVREVLTARDDFDRDDPQGIYEEMVIETTDWRDEQCQSREMLGSNEYDAFGHCWVACEATRRAGAKCSADLGFGREVWREAEDFFGGDSHDSFRQDVTNQSVGRAVGATPEGSCYQRCDDAALDLSAPARVLWDCDAGGVRPDHLGIAAQCFETAEGTHEFENATGETIQFLGAETGSDNLIVQSPPAQMVDPGGSVNIPVSRSCNCPCDSGLSGQDVMTIEYQQDGRHQPTRQDVNVSTSCRRVPADCGGSGGDPHVWTFDGRRYDFQAVGEFVLARSAAGDMEIQVRQEPSGSSRTVSVNTAVAMRVGEHRVAFYAEGTPGLRGLYVDGGPRRDGGPGVVELPGGGRVELDGRSATVVWPEGHRVVTRLDHKSFDVVVHRRGGPVQGLLGDADGDESNDLRDGEQAPIRADDGEALYGPFRSAWQVSEATTLFDYAPGESVETFRDPSFPDEVLTWASLSDEQRAFGAEVCRREGVPAGWFRECVFDVAVTGDRVFATGIGDDLGSTADIRVPATATAGNRFHVAWRGPAGGRDRVAVVAAEAPEGAAPLARARPRRGTALFLTAPEAPGRYAVRYVAGDSDRTLAEAPLVVEPASARLEAAEEAAGGSRLEVTWEGPGGDRDYVAVADPEAPGGDFHARTWIGDTTGLQVDVPETPGRYELRYVQGRTRTVLARRPLLVPEPSARLSADDEAEAGGRLEVTWEGPGGTHDFIAVADPEAPGGDFHARTWIGDTTGLQVDVPETPGRYELRYVQGRTRTVLARRPLLVPEPSARLSAADEAEAGRRLDVTWEGPGGTRDYVAVADPEAPGGDFHARTWIGDTTGLQVDVPETPGRYELRYVQGRTRTVLARRPLLVPEPSARLSAADEAEAGRRLDVTWEGPGGTRDYVAVADPEAPGGDFHRRAWTSGRTSVRVDVPETPGRYELRYVQGRTGTVLARRPLRVE